MPDERMKLLTLDRWGSANLDKWWKKMDELELRERKEGKNGSVIEQEKWREGREQEDLEGRL